MADHPVPDDSSHYEISLTAGQAFIAFVLLLCSLGAAFAFGILVGRGRLDESLMVRGDPAVITEGEPSDPGRIVDLGAREPVPPPATATRDFTQPAAIGIEELAPTPPPGSEFAPQPAADETPAERQSTPPAESATPAPAGEVVIAQVLSSTEQKAAEKLAVKLIESGFQDAYVERIESGGATIHRVRVRFRSEAEARAAESRLKAISGTDPWITRP